MRTAQTAFTLVELMVVLSVIVVLLLISTNFGGVVANNRRAAAVNSFVAAFDEARSEAVSRGLQASMCRTASALSCTPDTVSGTACACTTTATPAGWATGWLIFVDPANTGVFDAPTTAPPYAAGSDVLIKHVGSLTGITITGSGGGADSISFNSFGTTPGFGNASFMVCDPRGAGTAPDYYARQITLSVGGRTRTQVPTSAPTCP